MPQTHSYLVQWFASIIQGAVNIEQSKYLNMADLQFLIGQSHRTLGLQRLHLHSLANQPEVIPTLLRWNYAQLEPQEQACDDFYLDPHTKHYTGSQQVLKGWCANIRWADKLINSDYIHTAAGSPIYLENGDNYEDLRTRLPPLLERFRRALQWAPTRTITLVIDRGIYSNEVFSKIASDPRHHLITWEKNYLHEPWSTTEATGHTTLEKSYNQASTARQYEFHWKERVWAKNPLLRQIEVCAKNPSGKLAHVSILTDDLTREVAQIVALMFNRWVQENDFKYLDKHYGINQITSYRSVPYTQLRDDLSDRQVPSQQWQALQLQTQSLIKKKARKLQAADQAQRSEQQRQARIAELEQALQQKDIAPQLRDSHIKEQRRHQQNSHRQKKYEQKRQAEIEQLHQQLETVQAQREETQRTVSRIDQVIEQGMVRLDTSSKSLMDVLKISARNSFYRSLARFKSAYDNYRDDHDYWRELTQSTGIVQRVSEQEVAVYLLPRSNHPPRLAQHIREELARHNATSAATAATAAEGSNNHEPRVSLHLADRRAVEVRLISPTD